MTTSGVPQIWAEAGVMVPTNSRAATMADGLSKFFIFSFSLLLWFWSA
jgi:hypothetical protein